MTKNEGFQGKNRKKGYHLSRIFDTESSFSSQNRQYFGVLKQTLGSPGVGGPLFRSCRGFARQLRKALLFGGATVVLLLRLVGRLGFGPLFLVFFRAAFLSCMPLL
ncbi:MAG: hypothetical protein HFE94_00005 [Acutalibacter sp.]|nr:hypothetical protein [Acutalibacter sp.]